MQKRNNSNNNIFHSESQIVVQKIFYFSPNYIKDLVSYKVYFQTKPSADVNKNGKFYFLIQWGAGQDLHKKKNWKSLLPNQEITTIEPIWQ